MRIKATVASTLYEMTRGNANGYSDAEDNFESRHQKLEALNALFINDYAMYYETERGFHPHLNNSVRGWNKISNLPFINMSFLKRSNKIRSAVPIIYEKRHTAVTWAKPSIKICSTEILSRRTKNF